LGLPIFAITIFVSAFLLFLVQPLVGKLILPKLGGTPQVWNTCMVFFQSVLLLGYAYTHSVTTRLKLRQQLMLHSGLLAIPIVMMFLFPMYDVVKGWTPPPGSNPIVDTLGILALIVGVPFFVVSTSAPLLQRWFAYSGHTTAKDPYFLYALSNLGSLLSLLLYPIAIEPYTFLEHQAYIILGGYIALAGLIVYCAYTISKLAPSDEQILATEGAAAAPPPPSPETPAPAPTPAPAAASTAVAAGAPVGGRGIHKKKGMKAAVGKADEPKTIAREPEPDVTRGALAPMSAWRRIRWVLLAFVPSSLMLGVTNYISTDMSPFPLVWVIPLALYLLSFILVFDKYVRWTSKKINVLGNSYTLQEMMLYVGQPLGTLVLCFISIRGGFDVVGSTILVMLGFFANALACHGEMALDRPNPRHLTEYFLLMSVGGMLGGLFNGIIAPVVFQAGVYEYYIVMVVACMVRPEYVKSGWFDELITNAFPGFKQWVVGQGDEMAKSLGRTPQGTTYLFSLFLDVVLGLFILSISYWLRLRYFDAQWLGSLMKFLGMPPTRDNETLVSFLRTALTVGPPLVFCFFFAGRPLRFGLATAGLLLGVMYFAQPERGILEARRTYFGLLRVQQSVEGPDDEEEKTNFIEKSVVGEDGKLRDPRFTYNFLMHGTTYHGRNYLYDPQDSYMREHIKDLSRLATTYYHRYGPVGAVMERYNWFPGPQNNFSADMRLPASLVGQLAAPTGLGGVLGAAAAQPYVEPAFATIGLGTGTMASYARPYQHLSYYEIDEVMRRFSLPEPERDDVLRFSYLENAIRRGVNLELIMGDARLTMQREEANTNNDFNYTAKFGLGAKKDLPKDRPYAAIPYEKGLSTSLYRQKFYKVIVVDAFSSDAIPIHLVTKQAIKLYLDKLDDDGVLCVHTSNRHMDLVRPVARIAMELSDESVKESGDPNKKVYCKVGKDRIENYGREWFMGHYSSEYVMIYRDKKIGDYLAALTADHDKLFNEWLEKGGEAARKEPLRFRPPAQYKIQDVNVHALLKSKVQWFDPYNDLTITIRGQRYVQHRAVTREDRLWTDDFSNILSVIRWHFPWQ
jgi:hypothetical protein